MGDWRTDAMLDKPLGQIGLADLRELITDKVREGKTIDYKQAMYLLDHADAQVRDKQREELLKDVSSFANTIGGHLIIGMAEDDQIPTAILGVPIADLDNEKNRLDQLIAQWLEPRISYDIHPIEVELGKYVLVIRVPQSLVSPHRVVYQKQFGQFYARNSTGAYQMDTSELRRAFNLSETIFEKIKGFRKERVRLIMEGETPVPIVPGPVLAMHLLPLSAFATRADFSVDTLKNKSSSLYPLDAQDRRCRINIDGVVIDSMAKRSYIQLFRIGMIEAVLSNVVYSTAGDNPGRWLKIGPIQDALLGMVSICLQTYRGLGVHPPIWLFLTLTQMKDVGIMSDSSFYEPRTIDRDLLYLPEALIDDLSMDALTVLRPQFDMIWNAASWDASWKSTPAGLRRWE
jgi:hypothetical protein